MILKSPLLYQNPLVSVVVVTYNQEVYIEKCIHSILEQLCNFPFEIIIGEDCGTDNTRNICQTFQKENPDKIVLLLQERNKGVVGNYIDAINLCRGEFIAQCAGDDYWFDKSKLQKQVDYLNINPKFGFVRTDFLKLINNKLTAGNGYYHGEGDVFSYAQYGPVGQASSICFRKELLKYVEFNEFIRRNFSIEDYPLHAILSKHTLFGFIPEKLTVYRQLKNSLGNVNPHNKIEIIKYIEGYSAVRTYLAELFPVEIKWWTPEIAHDYTIQQKLRIAYINFDYNLARIQVNEVKIQTASQFLYKLLIYNRLMFYFGCLIKNTSLWGKDHF